MRFEPPGRSNPSTGALLGVGISLRARSMTESDQRACLGERREVGGIPPATRGCAMSNGATEPLLKGTLIAYSRSLTRAKPLRDYSIRVSRYGSVAL